MSGPTDLNKDNPFPGMNPYLEQHWRDVHTSLMIYVRDQLQAGLPADLWASVEEEVTIDEAESGPIARAYPDVQVAESWGQSPGLAAGVKEAAVAEPFVLVDPEPATERCVQIFAAGGRLITAIEVPTPNHLWRLQMPSAPTNCCAPPDSDRDSAWSAARNSLALPTPCHICRFAQASSSGFNGGLGDPS